MASNKLMEAAADILSQSKKGASAMPAQKLEGEVVDVGGPTPQNSKPDDESNKLDTTKAAKSATAPTTKPSAASSKMDHMKMTEASHEDEEEDEEDDEEENNHKKKMKEDIDALFADDSTISEEFKVKASTIFEARVMDRVSQIQEELEEQYASVLEEAVESIKEDLAQKVDDYLNYIVEQWVEENQIAIESGLRAELTEEFIAGLRNLFAEHYIDVPSEKVDLVDELATKVQELEEQLNQEIEHGVELKKALVESVKSEITREVSSGLTETQVEKMKTLAESVDFSTEEEYKQKLETIRENYFPSGVKKVEAAQLHEQVEESEERKLITDPFVAAVSQAISKTKF